MAKLGRTGLHEKAADVNKHDRSTREQAIADLKKNPDLYRRYRALARRFVHDEHRLLLFWHSVGREVDHTQRNRKVFGVQAADRLADALGRGRSSVYKAVQMFRTWPSVAQFREEIVDRKGPNGYQIGSSHLFAISHVPEDPDA
jgi:hypothetical protein